MSKCRVDMDKTQASTAEIDPARCRHSQSQEQWSFSCRPLAQLAGGSCCADHSALELNVGSTNGSYQAFESAESNQQLLLVGDLNQIWSPAITQCHLGARLQPVYPESPAGRSIMASIYFALLGIGGCCLGEGGGESPAALALKKQWRHWNPKMPQGTLVLGDAWWCLWS